MDPGHYCSRPNSSSTGTGGLPVGVGPTLGDRTWEDSLLPFSCPSVGRIRTSERAARPESPVGRGKPL